MHPSGIFLWVRARLMHQCNTDASIYVKLRVDVAVRRKYSKHHMSYQELCRGLGATRLLDPSGQDSSLSLSLLVFYKSFVNL